MPNTFKYLYEKTKYYFLALISLLLILASSFLFESDFSVEERISTLQAFLSGFWLQITIFALLLAIVMYLLVQYFIYKNMELLREEKNKMKEKAEIHNMRYSVRK